ncbi:hypothetical protein QYM41_16350 [Kocuria sp. CPCC 205268]|uniref:hypothetical protein n=1 Tax=Kocuria oxytropis TaxID=3058913 RepID=UPI0034D51D5F
MSESDVTRLSRAELYTDPPLRGTVYPWWLRLVDGWAGRRDSKCLSTIQQTPPRVPATEVEAGEPPVLNASPVPVTPWAEARIRGFRQVADKEALRLEAALDPLKVELTQLRAAVELHRDTVARAREAEEALRKAGPEEAVASGPGERYASPDVLSARRGREFTARLAAATSVTAAAQRAVEEAQLAVARVEERIQRAEAASQLICRETWELTRGRLSVYGRAVARRHPDAPVVPALTVEFDLDPVTGRPPRPEDPGRGPGLFAV